MSNKKSLDFYIFLLLFNNLTVKENAEKGVKENNIVLSVHKKNKALKVEDYR